MYSLDKPVETSFGEPSGLIVSNDAEIMKRIDQIAFPGLTANFDAAKSAALAITLIDWKDYGNDYARCMQNTALALAEALANQGIPVFETEEGFTKSHQFAVQAADFGGGQTASMHLRKANILACGIGLPMHTVKGDLNGLRLGTPEIVRFGMQPADMKTLADYIVSALKSDSDMNELAKHVSEYRQQFKELHYIHK